MTQIVSGNADDPTRDMGNWNSIVNIVNGQLGDVNFGTTDVLSAAKTVLGTYTAPTAHSISYTGFSANPTTTACVYTQIGKLLTLHWVGNANGTASGGTFTISLPVAPQYKQTFILFGFYSAQYILMIGVVASGSTTMTVEQATDIPNMGASLGDNTFAALTLGWGTASNTISYIVA